jgi:4-amino-4-deoxy-L-arabinose transferase-like glycosyltransferase
MQTDTSYEPRENVLSRSLASKAQQNSSLHYLDGPINFLFLFILTLAAFLPRAILARQLDVVTDETVYILAGKIDFHLAAHLNFLSEAWDYNYEHPALVKLLIGLALFLNTRTGHFLPELFAARIPSILAGTLLVIAVYSLGKAPFGRSIAFSAALCLAFSPWLSYFGALAYLDTTMTLLVSLAFLLAWHAPRHPWLYPLIATCMALGTASKYTAILALPGLLIYLIYAFLVQCKSQTEAERRRLPWLWWAGACITLPLTFFSADPSIWRNPPALLLRSLNYQWEHSTTGHMTFLGGEALIHAPAWTLFLILFTKISLFVTLPATGFLVLALLRLIPTHKHFREKKPHEVFLLCWLLGILVPFSQLTIVVGTHYELPAAPPVALAAAYSVYNLINYLQNRLHTTRRKNNLLSAEDSADKRRVVQIVLLSILLAGPHMWGLMTNYAAEGYTSEIFQGENSVLQVAYPGYREAALWLEHSTRKPEHVGLVALVNTLNHGEQGVSWYNYNADAQGRLQFSEAHPDDKTFAGYDYLIWPMHLIQRGYPIPPPWNMHIIHTITGGQTTYCYILARSSVSISR